MGANLYIMSKCKCYERKIQWNIYLLFAEILFVVAINLFVLPHRYLQTKCITSFLLQSVCDRCLIFIECLCTLKQIINILMSRFMQMLKQRVSP